MGPKEWAGLAAYHLLHATTRYSYGKHLILVNHSALTFETRLGASGHDLYVISRFHIILHGQELIPLPYLR